MPRCFTATYTTYYNFAVPKNVFLLPESDDRCNDGVTIGSWWVKWAIFHYINEKGETIEIEGTEFSEHKIPDNLEEADEIESDNE